MITLSQAFRLLDIKDEGVYLRTPPQTRRTPSSTVRRKTVQEAKMNRCRLCGAEPTLCDLYYGWYVVRCSNDTCGNHVENTISDSKERAIIRWNNRNQEDHPCLS